MLSPAPRRPDTHSANGGATTFPTSMVEATATNDATPGTFLPPTSYATTSGNGSSAAPPSLPAIHASTPNGSARAGEHPDPGQRYCETRTTAAGADPGPGQPCRETHTAAAGANLNDALLAVLADALDDRERTRIATENRIRSLRQIKGLEGTPFEARLTEMLDGIKTLEHAATLDLQRAMRLHPLHAFVKATKGLGEKQAARLLAAIGDPATRSNPAKLWQYAGHGDPARSRRRRGHATEFNPTAKMRVHLCAESMLRCGNRAVYDRERAKWAARDVSDGHKHNHALRVMGKQLLLDLWKAARDA